MTKATIVIGSATFSCNPPSSKLYIRNRIISVLSGSDSGLMVSVLNSGSSVPGCSPGQGHCVAFLGKMLFSHSASLHPGPIPAELLVVRTFI